MPVSIDTLMNRSLPPGGLILVTSTSWNGVWMKLAELIADEANGPNTIAVLEAAAAFSAAVGACPNAGAPQASIATTDIPAAGRFNRFNMRYLLGASRTGPQQGSARSPARGASSDPGRCCRVAGGRAPNDVRYARRTTLRTRRTPPED